MKSIQKPIQHGLLTLVELHISVGSPELGLGEYCGKFALRCADGPIKTIQKPGEPWSNVGRSPARLIQNVIVLVFAQANDIMLMEYPERQHLLESRALKTELVGGEEYSYYPLGEYIVQAPGVCGGRPTFKYTRIEVSGILARLSMGETVESITEGFCGRVSREAVFEALRLAADRVQLDFPGLAAA